MIPGPEGGLAVLGRWRRVPLRGWTWHPEARQEAGDLKEGDVWAWLGLVKTIQRLMLLQRQGESAGPINGRVERWCPGGIRQFISFVDGTCCVVYFVERRDGHGYGGLLFDKGPERGPAPNGACETAQERLFTMPGW
jgi:hypothetical protein